MPLRFQVLLCYERQFEKAEESIRMAWKLTSMMRTPFRVFFSTARRVAQWGPCGWFIPRGASRTVCRLKGF